MQEVTVQLGLLMEAARAQQDVARTQQALVERCLESLQARIAGLPEVVGEVVRHTVSVELRNLQGHSQDSRVTLRRLARTAVWSELWRSATTAAVCVAMPLAGAWWILPSRSEIVSLREQRAELESALDRLRDSGARIDLRRCGGRRWCVRIDRHAPVYGDTNDYFVVQGY